MRRDFKTKKLKSWMLKGIAALNDTGITQDIHVDELLEKFDQLKKGDVFMRSCLLFNYLVDYLEVSKINTDGINVFLSIDLISESNVFTGKPTSLAEVESLIDDYSIPEIVLHRDLNPNEIPLTEIYRVPILVDYFSMSTPISIFYKEYRAFEDVLNNGDFTRTIDVYYMQYQRYKVF
jgi:hypothetical protein